LFWDVKVSDETAMLSGIPRTVLDHYLRIKIFTERGRDAQSSIDLVHTDGSLISDVAARTIAPDGKIVELKKTDIFERTIVKFGGRKLAATSFVLPGVDVGAIIEYQWRELRPNSVAMFVPLECQRDIPVRLVRYHIKPLALPGFDYGMRVEA